MLKRLSFPRTLAPSAFVHSENPKVQSAVLSKLLSGLLEICLCSTRRLLAPLEKQSSAMSEQPGFWPGGCMHVSVTGTKAEVSDAKAQSLTYVVLLATTAAISGFLFGFDTAVINGVLLFLRRQFVLSNLQTEIAASSLLLGCLLGAAAASMIGDRYGRKTSLIASAILFALSSVGAASAST